MSPRRILAASVLSGSLISANLMLSGCSTTLKENGRASEGTAVDSAEAYEARIEKYSAGDTEYSGLYNNFEYKATILNSDVRETQHRKRTHYYQWDDAKAQAERQKYLQEMASQTTVFVAFFTPDNKNDNLTDIKSIWRVYLDANGRRYEAKIKRIRLLPVEIQALYPYHTRWTTPYEATFDVPTAAIEGQPSTFTITGPLGTRAVTLPALNH